MCIIVIKPIGKALPSKEIIKNCVKNNPDGNGFMYNDPIKNNVVIKKGYMNFESFYDALTEIKNPESITIIFHARISTCAGVTPENCHPFPLTTRKKELQLLSNTTKIGVAHNGIIPIKVSDNTISDTMEYIKTTLSKYHRKDKQFYINSKLMHMIENDIQSKMVFLLPDGNFYLANEQKFIEDGGYIFSNTTYESYEWGYYSTHPLIDDEDVDDYEEFQSANMLEYEEYIKLDGARIYGSEMDIYVTENDDVIILDGETYDPIPLYGARAYEVDGKRYKFSRYRELYLI